MDLDTLWSQSKQWFQENTQWTGVLEHYWDAFTVLSKLFVEQQWFAYQSKDLSSKEKETQSQAMHSEHAQQLEALCRRQGGAWVKVAQLLSCHSFQWPPIYRDTLSQLQDQADPVAWDVLIPILEESLGPQWQQRFEFIDPKPLATASIGQVHRAILKSGQVIALKIQLPQASQKIHADLQFFQAAATLFNSKVPGIDLEQLISELSKSVLKELDYFGEAQNLTQFLSHYRIGKWEFPLLVSDLLTPKTLGMHFVEGTPIRDFLKNTPGVAKPVLLELIQTMMQQIFEVGVFHADPHPGNIFITPQGKLAFLDFGAIGTLSQHEQEAYQQVLFQLWMKSSDLIPTLEAAGFEVREPDVLKEKLAHPPKPAANALSQIQNYLQLLEEAQVQIPNSFVLIARALVSVGGVLQQYQVRFSLKDWMELKAKQAKSL